MKFLVLQLLIFVLPAVGVAVGADPANTNLPSRFDFPSFRIIAERNIFDPNRSGRTGRPVQRTETERRVASETFALLGTMSYEKGRFAFFDGSGSQYRKVLQPADSIAGFKIASVDPTCVKLETTNGQIVELCVGMQMKHREEEGWQLAGSVEPSDGGRSGTNSGTSTGSASAGESEELLKKLLAQREQEAGTEKAAEPIPATEEKKPASAEKNSAPADEGDEVLKRLLQKREQELNK